MKRIDLRRASPLLVVLVLAAAAWEQFAPGPEADADRFRSSAERAGPLASDADARLAAAFRERVSDLQVEGAGRVVTLLPDDEQGSRHQRFLLELATGQTLLVAHNIDLAPRIDALRRGDRVRFYGEYEWNERGGVIHWTHHDPRGAHPGGWLEHDGHRYQ
jgi:hypothetical protein